jgi:hypothetical protein
MFRESKEFENAIRDDTGRLLAKLETDLRARFGTYDGTRSIRSALSKVAAFIRPDRFVAWDQYAPQGVNLVLGRPKSTPFKDYAEYLAAFDDVWKGPNGERIREMTNKAPHQPLETEPRFQRRVLDLYLMNKGGL